MPTYDEVMATAAANMSGMDEEERRRRQALIEATVQRDPELARMIASGPYQMNESVGSTMSSQEAWSRGPQYPNSPSYGAPPQQRQAGTYPYSPSGGTPPQTSGGTSPVVQQPTRYNYSPSYGQPVTPVPPSSSGPVSSGGAPATGSAPRYDFPQNATGQPVTVNINWGGGGGMQNWMKPQDSGYDNSGWYNPPSQVQQTPQQRAIQQQIYNPPFQTPQMQPQQGPPQMSSLGASYGMPSYPYSPQWAGQPLNGMPQGVPTMPRMPQGPQQMSSLGASYGMPSYPYSPQWAGIPLNGVR